jgi:hypothetical protein
MTHRKDKKFNTIFNMDDDDDDDDYYFSGVVVLTCMCVCSIQYLYGRVWR